MALEESRNFEIKKNDIVGRYAVASCDLEPGEEILSEIPFAYGPKTDSPPICLGCYSETNCSVSCTSCGWPVCNPICESNPAHKDFECRIFTNAGVKFIEVEDPNVPCLQYECITPLRVLLAMEKDRETWNSDIDCLQSHDDERKSEKIWHFNTINIVNYLRGPCGLHRFDEKLIHRVCGILDVNTFEARTKSGSVIRCLYPKASIFSHRCITNIAHSIFTDEYGPGGDFRIVVRASVSINKDVELFARYTYSTCPTLKRREFLKKSKYFDCDCERCADPRELGTNMSTLKCDQCHGDVISANPLNRNDTIRVNLNGSSSR